MKDSLVFKKLEEKDLGPLSQTFLFPWTTLSATQEKWQKYLQEQAQQKRTAILVTIDEEIVGYGSLIQSEYPYFLKHNIPELNDLWIKETHRGKGLGTSLIRYLEQLAKASGYKEIGLGVGLYKDYGSAQKLYCKMGYVPDGNGITYLKDKVIPGNTYPVDDELVLWLKKTL